MVADMKWKTLEKDIRTLYTYVSDELPAITHAMSSIHSFTLVYGGMLDTLTLRALMLVG